MNSELQKITDSIYILPHYSETDRPTLGIISGTHASLIIDAGNSFSHANLFNQKISQLDVAPIKEVVITHWHWDHWFGNSFYNIPIVANSYTRNEIEKQSKYEWTNEALDYRVKQGLEIEFCSEHIKKEFPDPTRKIEMKIPDVIISDTKEIDLGNITCLLESVDSDHCNQNTIVFVPERKILFLGDALYMNLYAKKWNYTTNKLFPFLDKLKSYDADIIVGSHSNPMSREEYTMYFEELRNLGKTVERIGDDYKKIVAALKSIGFVFDDHIPELIKAFVAGQNKWL